MKRIIKFCYTKVIDASSALPWDRQVFDDTYREYFMQAQQFDQEKKYDTFQEILANRSKANDMHYLVSTSAVGHIRKLDGLFPEVINTLGKRCIPFKNFQFEIIQSSRSKRSLHKVGIFLYSEPLIWLDTLPAGQLVVGNGTDLEKFKFGEEIPVDTITLTPNVGIASLKVIDHMENFVT